MDKTQTPTTRSAIHHRQKRLESRCNLCSSIKVWRHGSQPYNTNYKIMDLYILIINISYIYLIIYVLFNNVFSISVYIALGD
jgi:hypothetical protein